MKKIYKIKINSKVYEVELEEVKEVEGNIESSSKAKVKEPTTNKIATKGGEGVEDVTSPMPGNVFRLEVKVGDRVKKDQVVVILEAMKMEAEVISPCDGVVESIVSPNGTAVELGDVILTINRG